MSFHLYSMRPASPDTDRTRDTCSILKIRDLAIKGASVSTLIDIVIEGTDYKGHLERTHGVDAITRLENINELK